jgi:FKBP-type peptidyl-prolyl cis-trans isomerase SlyD
MQIAKDKVVGIHYTLRSTEGETLDSSQGRDPLFYIHGNGQLVPGLEEALEGKDEGEKLRVSVPPEKGYGEYNQGLIQTVARSQFQQDMDIQPGMQFQAQSQAGPIIVTVTEVKDDQVTIDGNHVLAGKTLDFEIEVTKVREATSEEMAHGHVHGPDGQATH